MLSGHFGVHLALDQDPIAELKAGEVAGEVSLISGEVTSAFVVADCDSVVMVLDEETVWEVVNMSHAVASNLLHTLAKRLRYGNDIIADDREQLARYRFHANVDALTGTFNRRWLNNMLPRLMDRAKF